VRKRKTRREKTGAATMALFLALESSGPLKARAESSTALKRSRNAGSLLFLSLSLKRDEGTTARCYRCAHRAEAKLCTGTISIMHENVVPKPQENSEAARRFALAAMM
jgi:hypothetical protein